MKRVRLGRRRMTCAELNKCQRYSLRSGQEWFRDTWPGADEQARAQVRREAWRRHGRALVKEWAETHPGIVPWALTEFGRP